MKKDFSNIQHAKDELHRLIGRNLLEFQRYEQMIKWMIVENGLSGEINDLNLNREVRAEKVRRQTLGQLIPEYIDSIFTEIESDSVAKLKGIHYSFEFSIKTDEGELTRYKKSLEAILIARNEFIHHLFMRVDRSSIESCITAIKEQEELYKEIIKECSSLGALIEQFEESRVSIFKYLATDEGRQEFVRGGLICSAQNLLERVASESSRSDGWTLLSIAGSEVITESPNLMADLCCKSLKELILACEIFELKSEATGKGFSIFFRKKS